jgi:thymidylate synthase
MRPTELSDPDPGGVTALVYGPSFATFQQAYLAVLRQVATKHQYTIARCGRDAVEVINTSFTIADPVDRMPYLAACRANVVFHHAEALWCLASHADLDMIGYYAPGLQRPVITRRLTGTACVPWLFDVDGDDGGRRFDRAMRRLADDPHTDRAVMTVARPDELVDAGDPDAAGALGLQFLVRDGRLHLAAYLRGNDALAGLLRDGFSFTFLLEFAARRIGVPVGTYSHHAGSMRLNLTDLERVDAILAEADHLDIDAPRFPTPTMPATSRDDLTRILHWELALRTNTQRLDPVRLDRLPVPVYWQQVLALFEAHRQIIHEPNRPVTADAMAALHPGHRWLVAARWPQRMPATVNPPA